MPPKLSLPDNPKAALENYINEMGTLYDRWYETAVQRHHAVWLALQAVAVLAGLVTAIVAALYGNEPLDRVTRTLFVVLPVLAAGASPLVIVFRNLMKLREAGRQRIQYLFESGTARLGMSQRLLNL